jgi:hypothetical protein
MSCSPSADERRIVCGQSADDLPLVCRPNFSLAEINSFGLNFSVMNWHSTDLFSTFHGGLFHKPHPHPKRIIPLLLWLHHTKAVHSNDTDQVIQ